MKIDTGSRFYRGASSGAIHWFRFEHRTECGILMRRDTTVFHDARRYLGPREVDGEWVEEQEPTCATCRTRYRSSKLAAVEAIVE